MHLPRAPVCLRVAAILLAAFALCGAAAAASLVQVTVKETAGVGSVDWPTTVVIPLPAGRYQTTNTFTLTDAGGTAIPAQFVPIERWWNGDGSIRHLVAHFQADVAAAGTARYELRDDGLNPQPADPVVVADCTAAGVPASACPGAGTIVVKTGPLQFTVRKTGFNILDTVWYDADGDRTYESSGGAVKADERIIQPSANHGGRFDGCSISGSSCVQDLQHDSGLDPDRVTIEEQGPMRAVLRLERYTRYRGAANHDHGYVVRLYAYAGKPWIKVDYQLINAATDDNGNTLDGGKWSDPLYFNSLDLSWNLQLAGAGTVRTSVRNNGVDARALDANGVELAYTMHDNYALRYANGATSYSTCTDAANDPTNDCDTAGFMDLADGAWGVQAVLRNMWELWPGGFQASDPANHNLQVQLFPDWSGNYYSGQVRPLYWLDDMQAVYKEVLLNFHGATPADSTLMATARSFDRYPVPTLPVAHYRDTAVTLDLDGRTQRGTRLGTDTLLERYTGSDLNETNSGSYLAGWNRWYAAQAYRLIDASEPGDGPEGAETFIATESPDDFWNVQRWVLSELNARPEWMGTDYTFADDWAAMQLEEIDVLSQSEGYWRADGNTASYPIAGSGRTNEPRDQEHGWFYHMGSYWYDYNLWVRDWLAWQAQFRRTRTVADEAVPSERAIGHSLWVTWLAYRATGDVALLDSIADYIGDELGPDISPLCGRLPYYTGSSSALEMGFLTRPLQSALADLKGQDWPRWAKVFQFVSAYQEWNFHYGRYAYHQDDDGLCTFNQSSSGTSWNVLDPVAWYYWNTGKLRFKQNNDDYYNGGLVGGGGPYTNTSGEVWLLPEPEWDGSYSRRYFDYVSTATRSDATPPAAPTNVAAILAAGTLTVNWTPSANAGTSPYYLIVSADRPLVECTTGCTTDTQSRDVANFRNWWAARPQACGGACASVTIPAVTCNPCYAAVFAFDDANNMSPMSAVATSQPGSGNPPPAPQGLRVN